MNGEILEELSNGIVEIINSNIEKVILYGSFARGTNDKDSDVDIMVIVKNELDKLLKINYRILSLT